LDSVYVGFIFHAYNSHVIHFADPLHSSLISDALNTEFILFVKVF